MESNENLSFHIPSGFSWWNKRTRLEKILLVLFGFALITAVVCIIVLIAISRSGSIQGEICITEKCALSASNLLQSIDPHNDPCEDFYGYACGNWKKNHPIPDNANLYSWIHEKTNSIQHNVRDFLRQNYSDGPSTWIKARALYKSCLDTDTLDLLKMKPVFELMKMIGLQEIPPLPVSSELANENEPKLNWLAIAARAKKLLSIDLFVGFNVQPFFKPDVNMIVLGPVMEKSFFPGFINSEENAKDLLASMTDRNKGTETNATNGSKKPNNNLVDYRRDVLSYIYNKSADEVVVPVEKMIMLEYKILLGLNVTVPEVLVDHFKQLPQLINATQNLTTIEDEQIAHITIDTLQKLTDAWSNGTFVANWREYFSILFEDVKGVNIRGNDKILVLFPKYIKSLVQVMSVTPREQAEMVMWWNVINAVAGHTTAQLRNINEKYSKESSGIEVISSRSMVCTKVVMHTMSMAALSFSANSEFLATTKKTMDEMYTNVKDAFTSIVSSSAWLNSETKKSIIETVHGIPIITGYPKWLLDRDKLDKYYNEVEINEGQFLLDAANITRWTMGKKLTSLAKGPLTDEYFINPTIINAYYSSLHHSITFLAGYLQFPFYDLGHDALNYGLTATVLSHELHHAFDTRGIMFKNGELGLWWNTTFIEEFLERRKCFIRHYSKYDWDNNLKVNGNLTVNEDMPDHGGLHTSLVAYQKILKKKGSELQLPGLTNYTSEQLFFLSFANFFCSDITEAGKKQSLRNVHTPFMFRVTGSVTNSEEFARIWKCPKGTKMNPNEQKCKLW